MKRGWPAKNIDMEKAKTAIMEYRKEHGLDASKIDGFQKSWDSVGALKYKNIKPDGLRNDMETLPDVLLYYDLEGNVHETEYTEKFLRS